MEGKTVCTQKAEMTTVGRASLFITQFRAQNLKHETSFPPRQLAFYEIEAFFCPTAIQPHSETKLSHRTNMRYGTGMES